MWTSLVGPVAAVIFGYFLFSRKSKRAVQGAQLLANDSGPNAPQGELSAKMRLLDERGPKRRWREVVIRRGPHGQLSATPYRPRRAASFDLSGTQATGRRDSRMAEKWWFAGPTVLIADGDLGPVEFGFGTATESDAATIVFGLPGFADARDDPPQ